MTDIIPLWTEKYRPKSINDYVFVDPHHKEQVENWVKAKTIPNLLFTGKAGLGKTSLAKLLITELGVNQYDLLVINAARERGIDIIRDRIKTFCSTMPFGDLKVVLLDEMDALTPQAQASLKGTMEEFTEAVRFILTSNHPTKIIPPLHSRCQTTHFDKIDHTEFTARVATVLVTEGITFDLDTLDDFVRATYPDLRKCLNLLQQKSTSGTLRANSSADIGSSDWQLEMVKLFKAGKIREARQLVCSSVQGEDIDNFFRWAYDNLDLWSTTEEGQDDAILIIRQALVNHSLVADPEINVSAMLCELSRLDR